MIGSALGILAVSTPLLRAGYQIRIIDSTITPNFQKRVLEELSDALCLAVSLVTGPMIRETVQMAREVKRLYPQLPIVLGGWCQSEPRVSILVTGTTGGKLRAEATIFACAGGSAFAVLVLAMPRDTADCIPR